MLKNRNFYAVILSLLLLVSFPSFTFASTPLQISQSSDCSGTSTLVKVTPTVLHLNSYQNCKAAILQMMNMVLMRCEILIGGTCYSQGEVPGFQDLLCVWNVFGHWCPDDSNNDGEYRHVSPGYKYILYTLHHAERADGTTSEDISQSDWIDVGSGDDNKF